MRDDSGGPLGLAVERGQSLVGDIARDAGRREVVANQRVTRTACGERRRPALGEAGVVDEPGPAERLERLLASVLVETASGEFTRDLRRTAVAMA